MHSNENHRGRLFERCRRTPAMRRTIIKAHRNWLVSAAGSQKSMLVPRLVATQMLFPAEDHPEIARCLLAEEDPRQAAVNFLAKTGTDPKDLYIWIAAHFAA